MMIADMILIVIMPGLEVINTFEFKDVLYNVILIEEFIGNYLVVIFDFLPLNNKKNADKINQFINFDVEEVRVAQLVFVIYLEQPHQGLTNYRNLFDVRYDYVSIIVVQLWQ